MLIRLRSIHLSLFKNAIPSLKSIKHLKHFSNLTSDQHKFVSDLFNGVVGNKRADLAKAITLIETTSPSKKILSQTLLNNVLHKLKQNRENNEKICLRVG